jgi:hypothetical protein
VQFHTWDAVLTLPKRGQLGQFFSLGFARSYLAPQKRDGCFTIHRLLDGELRFIARSIATQSTSLKASELVRFYHTSIDSLLRQQYNHLVDILHLYI